MTTAPPKSCTVNHCGRDVIARGMCTKHYKRWRKRNPHLITQKRPPIERLLQRCEVDTNGCWIYQGALTEHGYSRIHTSKDTSNAYGHLIAWEHFRGSIPDGLTFDHLCNTPACVNPWHGDLVPLSVNLQRATTSFAAINRAKTRCPQGHPYDETNTYHSPHERRCRACGAAKMRRYRARKKKELQGNDYSIQPR